MSTKVKRGAARRQLHRLVRRRWRNAWKHKPPIGQKVLIWMPNMSGKGGDYTIDVIRQKGADGEIWWQYGNTILWMELPSSPPNVELTRGAN